ncbi:helix-turn-helix domain-containing protein [Megasphaera elsdenii]|uniref:helix-turn-helix domain-containing protein n=1 Tax=Megasphaera elsdenii TaxID=907 RepID=UPI00265F2607|nr:helix-turn-helix transcriptional regulator [Megasphaera elsdenii]
MISARTEKVDFNIVDRLINEKFISWAELARMAGISSATIFAIKAGRRNASFRTIRKIADALGVEPKDIVKG